MSGQKSTKIETDKRTRAVQEWMMQGHSSSDIVRQCTAQWNITGRQAYKYIRKAYEAFREQAENDIEARKQFHIQSRLKLFRDLQDKKSSKPAGTALAILQDIAKLEGLYVEKTEIVFDDKQRIKSL
ncbi:MAG: hypothetical protein FD166_3615, partial [Bacteroidetes bacterium]